MYKIKFYKGRFLVIERSTGYMVANESTKAAARVTKTLFEALSRDGVIALPTKL